jgi:hypothetical protein
MGIHQMLFTDPNVIEAPPIGDFFWTQDIVPIVGQNGTSSPNLCNIWYRRHILMWVYSAAELTTAFGKNTAVISNMRFLVNQQPLYQPLPSYAIGLKNGSFSITTSPGHTGYTIVKPASSESFTSNQVKTFDEFPTSFEWTGGDLAIAVAWGQCPTTYNQSGTNGITNTGTLWWARSDSSGAYTINTDNISGSTTSTRPSIQFYVQ